MASAGDIRAGGAYVQLALETGQFDAGLARIGRKVQAFGESLSTIGFNLTTLTSTLSIPFAMMSKAFLETADDLRKNRIETAFEVKAETDKASFRRLERQLFRLGATVDDDIVKLANRTRNATRIMQEALRALSAEVGAVLAPGIQATAVRMTALIRTAQRFVETNPKLIKTLGMVVGALTAIGTATFIAGMAISALGFALTGLSAAMSYAPWVLMAGAVVGLIVVFTGLGEALMELMPLFKETAQSAFELFSSGRYVEAIRLIGDTARVAYRAASKAVLEFIHKNQRLVYTILGVAAGVVGLIVLTKGLGIVFAALSVLIGIVSTALMVFGKLVVAIVSIASALKLVGELTVAMTSIFAIMAGLMAVVVSMMNVMVQALLALIVTWRVLGLTIIGITILYKKWAALALLAKLWWVAFIAALIVLIYVLVRDGYKQVGWLFFQIGKWLGNWLFSTQGFFSKLGYIIFQFVDGIFQGTLSALKEVLTAVLKELGQAFMHFGQFAAKLGEVWDVVTRGVTHLARETGVFIFETFKKSLGGVTAMLRRGDFEGAWKLTIATLKVAWFRLVKDLQAIWFELWPKLLSALSSFIQAIHKVFSAIQKIPFKVQGAALEVQRGLKEGMARRERDIIHKLRKRIAELEQRQEDRIEKHGKDKALTMVAFKTDEEHLRKGRKVLEKHEERLRGFVKERGALERKITATQDDQEKMMREGLGKAAADLEKFAERAKEAAKRAPKELEEALKRAEAEMEKHRKRDGKLKGLDFGLPDFGLDKFKKEMDKALDELDILGGRSVGVAIQAQGSFSAADLAIIGGEQIDPVVIEAKKMNRMLAKIERKVGPPRFR